MEMETLFLETQIQFKQDQVQVQYNLNLFLEERDQGSGIHQN